MRTYPLYVLVLRIYSFSQRLEFSHESLFRVSKFRFDFHSQVFDLAIFFFTIAQNAKLKTYEFRYQ